MLSCKKTHNNINTFKKPNVILKEDSYLLNLFTDEVTNLYTKSENSTINGLTRADIETAENALEKVKRFTRLLALRDQECEDSRGYEFCYSQPNYTVYKNHTYCKPKYEVSDIVTYAEDFTVYFKTFADAQKICNILNEGRFNLEGG